MLSAVRGLVQTKRKLKLQRHPTTNTGSPQPNWGRLIGKSVLQLNNSLVTRLVYIY